MNLDLFAGMGGWSAGLHMLGLDDLGLECAADECATRAAAGFATLRADVAAYPVERFAGKVEGLVASPPCPDWSVAGKGAKRDGASGWLVDTVPTWVEATRPEWVACEQVPPVLDVWREHAERYRQLGYSVWCGLLNSADFGVPQTRTRAFLLASRVRAAVPPEPTHAKVPKPGLFGHREKWVSMADVLGWSAVVDRRTNSRGPRGTVVPSVLVGADRPAPTLVQAGRWVVNTRGERRTPDRNRRAVSACEPAPTVHFGHDAASWCWERPATTVVSTFRPDVIAAPGYRHAGDGPRQDAEGSVRISTEEALILQSFPPHFPVQGSRTAKFRQIGNAVPPLMAAHVLAGLTSRALDLERVA